MYSKDEVTKLKAEFWRTFKKKGRRYRKNSGKWVMRDTGIKGLQLKIEMNRNQAAVMMHLYRSKEKSLILFEILEQYKRVLAEFWSKEAPVWEKNCTLKGYENQPAVYFIKTGFDWYDQKQWPEIHQFLIEKMDQLEKAFLEIKDVVKEEFKELS